MTRLPLLALGALLLAACGGSAPAAEVPQGDPLAPRSLYPMEVGWGWSYQVDTGIPPAALGSFGVIRAEGDVRVRAQRTGTVRTGPSPDDFEVTWDNEVEYQVSDEGIREIATGTWVLRAPIEVGAEWPSLAGRTARVTALDAAVEVPAGEFEGCVEVLETKDEGADQRTVYCPFVGPVLVEASQSMQLSMSTVRVTMRLLSYESPGAEEP